MACGIQTKPRSLEKHWMLISNDFKHQPIGDLLKNPNFECQMFQIHLSFALHVYIYIYTIYTYISIYFIIYNLSLFKLTKTLCAHMNEEILRSRWCFQHVSTCSYPNGVQNVCKTLPLILVDSNRNIAQRPKTRHYILH